MKKKLTYVEPDAYFNESMKKILETGNTDETKKAKKGYPRETLFEFYQDYTYMDEDYYNEITRSTFENLCEDLFDKCIFHIKKALESSKLARK